MNIDHEAIRRADDAKRVLSDPIVKQALEGIRKEIYSQWSATPARDSEGREWVWRHLKVLEKFEGILKGYIENGKIEKLREAESLAKTAKDKAQAVISRFQNWAA